MEQIELLYESTLSDQINDEESIYEEEKWSPPPPSCRLQIENVYSLSSSEKLNGAYSEVDVDSNFNKIRIKDLSKIRDRGKNLVDKLECKDTDHLGYQHDPVASIEDKIITEDFLNSLLTSPETADPGPAEAEDVIEEFILPVHFPQHSPGADQVTSSTGDQERPAERESVIVRASSRSDQPGSKRRRIDLDCRPQVDEPVPVVKVKRGRGRPKGSKNKKKKQVSPADSSGPCERCLDLSRTCRKEDLLCVCGHCGEVVGHGVSHGNPQGSVEDVEVLEAPTNGVNFPLFVPGTEILVEGEKIVGIKSPHDGLMGRNIYQFFSTLKEVKRGQKIIKVNVPHEVSSDKKCIKFAVLAKPEVRHIQPRPLQSIEVDIVETESLSSFKFI